MNGSMGCLQMRSFQSLKGFQPKWNEMMDDDADRVDPFQSLKGFQPKWNARKAGKSAAQASVSIPKRVSAKVERDNQLK